MDANTPANSRPAAERAEDLLDAMARDDENLGSRLLRMARTAATADRASILDLLLDDSVPETAAPSGSATSVNLNSPQESPSAVLRQGERTGGSDHGDDLVVVPGVRRMEVAR
jgi:hypothetical protein